MDKQLIVRRSRVLSMVLEFLNTSHPDEYCTEDFLVDSLVRNVLCLPERSIGKEPYVDYLIGINRQKGLR